MDLIRVHAPNEAEALRLLASLDGGVAKRLDGDGSGKVVALKLDEATATKLVGVFDGLGEWLTDGGLSSCQVTFGDRGYTLLAAKAGEPNDPTAFLLERTIQLQTALDSRVVIEQAKGILAERHSIGIDEAFERIRRDARSRRTKLRDVAADIVAAAGRSKEPVPG